MPESNPQATSHYALLGLKPGASVQAIRRAYRDLSKLYHPDTTTLPAAIATDKFQQLNEAYATLSNPERRLAYDHKIGYSRISVMQSRPDLNQPMSGQRGDRDSRDRSAYLDPTDRPLSAGEMFALFILGVTFAACLILVVAIGLTQGEVAFGPLMPPDLIEVPPADYSVDSPIRGEPIQEDVTIGNVTESPSPPIVAPSVAPTEGNPTDLSNSQLSNSQSPHSQRAAPILDTATPPLLKTARPHPRPT